MVSNNASKENLINCPTTDIFFIVSHVACPRVKILNFFFTTVNFFYIDVTSQQYISKMYTYVDTKNTLL